MKLKILLINPGQYLPAKVGYPLNTFQPMGLAYIAAVLLKNGYQVKILDVLAEGYNHQENQSGYRYIGLSPPRVRQKIKAFSPQVVGITAPFTAQAKAAHEMAAMVKDIDLKTKVVLGGSYPTTHPKEVLADKNIDFVVRGEGEITFLELVRGLEKKVKNFSKIKGLNFNPARLPLMHLDDYRVAWELLPMEKYFEAAYLVRSSRSISTFGKRWATIFTSRGCPFHCTFCVGHEVMGRTWRPRSVANVIAEMAFLIKKYQIQHFDIEDDNFTLDKERAKKICDYLIEKKWRIEWSTPNGIRADTVDEELIRKMKESGCVRTIVAPESGSQWVVDHLMNKKIDLGKIKQVVGWCRKYHLAVDAFFMIGMPGEKESQIKQTIKYAQQLRKLGVDDCGFGVVIPHQGTEIYEIADQKGWLRDFAKENLVEGLMTGEPMMETPYLSVKRLKELYNLANKVNPVIPYARLKLALLLLFKSPLRFLSLTFSYFFKRLGLAEGLLGAE